MVHFPVHGGLSVHEGAKFAVIDLPIVAMIKSLFSKNGGGGPFHFVTILPDKNATKRHKYII